MGSEIAKFTVPLSEAWVSFNKYFLDACTSDCESPCCKCGIETHAHNEEEVPENVEPPIKSK